MPVFLALGKLGWEILMSSWLSRYILRQNPVLGYRMRPPQTTKAVSIASFQSLYSKTVCWTQGNVWQDNRFMGEKKVSVVGWWPRHTEHP